MRSIKTGKGRIWKQGRAAELGARWGASNIHLSRVQNREKIWELYHLNYEKVNVQSDLLERRKKCVIHPKFIWRNIKLN